MIRCARCTAPLEPDTLGGLCPVCLLDAAFPDDVESPGAEFRYDLIEEIAHGGMGVVYRAVQHGSQRQVAVKMILAEQAATPGMMDRFRAEAEAVASLDHPHILPIYEIGETEGRPFYSMKFADGGTLRERAAQFAEPRDAARLIAALARAVHHAHERGILHRDLKPGNVLLDGPERRAFVSDFGLAKWMGRESRLTLAQSALGTPHYIAPEQAAGNSTKLTPAADVYSLGAMLYELLTGRPPFAGDTALETLRLAREMPTPPPRKFKPSVPRDLEVICLKCLAKEPAARYSTAVALAEDLERWLEGHTIVARPATAAERAWRWTNRNRALAGLSAALAVALVVVIFALTKSSPPMIRGAPAKSIAVLPFENLSGDAENAYFTQGIQDEIVTRLGKIADLKVISRTSTERFESSPQNLRVVSEQLGVANLLKGTVQKSGDQVRVRVQLIEASSGAHLWAEGYDRKLTDIFRVESDIAQAIAGTLQAKLSGAETQAIARRPTENPAAHQLYLKGRFFWNKTTESDLRKAIDYFTQAIAADPNYALAYVGVAESNLVLPFIAGGHPQDCYPTAKASAQRALEIDPALAEAHIALAETLRVYDFDTGRANTEFQKGIELDPNYAVGHWRYSWLLQSVGRGDEALAEMRRAVELDPLSLIINTDLGYLHTVNARYDQAIEQLHRTLEIDPNFYYAHGNLGEALEFKGSLNEALEEYAKTHALTDDPFGLALLAHIHAALGNTGEARKILDQLHEFSKKRYVQAYTFAVANLGLGEREEALRLLEQSYRDRAGGDISFIRVDPFLALLRGDPRFEALANKIAPRFSEPAKQAREKSIAVLSFENRTDGEDKTYFAQGVQDEILARLGRIADLKVISRTSTDRLGHSPDLVSAAEQLGVAHFLRGSVQHSGDAVRVTVQLIKAKTNEQLWAETYDRKLTDVFLVETEIAKAVAAKLQARLSGPEQRAMAARRTENPVAQQLYLKGRFFWNKRTAADLNKAIEYLNQAIAADPNYALAYAGLADAYVLSPFFGAGRPQDSYPKAKAAAKKALELDDNLAEAHIAHAEAARFCDLDFAGAEAEFQRALELDPNNANGHHWYGNGVLTDLGKFDQAIAEMKRALELDPLSLIINADLATTYTLARRHDEAIEQFRKTLEMDSGFYYARWRLAVALECKGSFPEALAEFEAARRISDDPWIIALQAHAYGASGNKAEARRLVDELKRVAQTRYVSRSSFTVAYLAVDEKTAAIESLEQSLAEGAGADLQYLKVFQHFDPLRGDPRFDALVAKVFPTARGSTPSTAKSLAVLPFLDLSERKDQEYFCDGVTEEILGALAKIDGLQVVARTSSFAFKGKNADIREIADKLGVQNILEGSLRREGNRVRLTAQLINAQTGFHLWSQTYERELQSIFALQDEMAKAIADALKIQLAPPITKRELPNLEAYDLYLQGLALSNKSGEADLRKSLELLQKSVEKDPNSSAAWTAIAKVWLWLADGYLKPLEAYPKSRAAANKALEIDERNAEAHTYLGDCKRVLDWDVEGEEVELKRALALDPNSGIAHLFFALNSAVKGMRESSLSHLEAALKADPLSPIISNMAGLLYITFGDLDKAIEQGRRTLQIDPGYVYEFPMLARAYAQAGRNEEAIALYKKGEEISGAPSAGLAVLYAQLHRDAEARELLKKIEEVAEKSYFQLEDIAEVYIALGDTENAFKWLERAVVEHSGPIHAVVVRPTFRALDSDPRFRTIIKRIGLDPDAVLPPAKSK
jgi:TolB-like protein/Tfp pilus assembly protein PilF